MPTPKVSCNLLVIRSSDIDRSAQFYRALGLDFARHTHGADPVHYAFESAGHTFEIYPLGENVPATSSTRIGFSVESVDEVYAALLAAGGEGISSPRNSRWGLRAVVADPDGHRVELTASSAGQ